MKAVIMAGGFGTRLRPVSGSIPKPMVPLLGKPMMEHIVELLKKHGITQICAAVKYRAEDIREYFGDGSDFGVEMCYSEENEPLGTAGSVKNCMDLLGNEDFLVISGDAACDFDLGAFIRAHEENSPAASIALYRSSQPTSFGLAVTDSEGIIRTFIEKPAWPRVVTDLVNTGIYILTRRAMELVPDAKAYDFGKELFPELLRRGEKILGVPMDGYWCDVGTPLSYYRCSVDAIEGRLNISAAEGFIPESHSEDCGEDISGLECPCGDRAAVMGVLSSELMELGARYSDGITLTGAKYRMHLSPSPVRSAVRIHVDSEDAEFARSLAMSMRDVIKALGI